MSDPTPLPGGLGTVFAAERRDDGQAVALKLLEGAGPEREAHLVRCFDLIREHHHPNLVAPIEMFRGPGLFSGVDDPPDEDSDLLYEVCAWTEGQSLRAAAPLGMVETARLAHSLAAVVTHLHDRCGVIHRDIHPGNIVVAEDGTATLIDLDALAIEGEDGAPPASGVVGFVPPERARAPWDRRSDRWAVGMVVAHALLGHPIGSDSADQLVGELESVLPKEVDTERVAALLAEMTEADPYQRRPDLTAWADELAAVLVPGPRTRKRVLLTVGAVAFLLSALFAGVWLGWWLDRSPDPGVAGPAEVVPLGEVADLPAAAGCHFEVGQSWSTAEDEMAELAGRLGPELAAATDAACAYQPAQRFGAALVQVVDGGDGDEPQVVVASSYGTVVLTPTQWASYRGLAGWQRPEAATELAGYPVEVVPDGDGTHLRLSGGGLLIGPHVDEQAFWVPAGLIEAWEEFPQLGLPVTNPYLYEAGMRQDFAGGHLFVPIEWPVTLDELDERTVFVLVDDDGS